MNSVKYANDDKFVNVLMILVMITYGIISQTFNPWYMHRLVVRTTLSLSNDVRVHKMYVLSVNFTKTHMIQLK